MRADKFLSERFGSRNKAREALLRGLVLRGGKPLRPSDELASWDGLVFLGEESYVSQGGYKLARGLDAFHLDVEGVYADLGASTGGFTDCLLQRGAERVYCVDVGESQLDPSLASDPRVVVMDGKNARFLTAEDFPEPIGGVVSDLSFISLRLVLPAVSAILKEGGHAVVLFKPQFEFGRGISKSGIVPPREHPRLLSEFYDFCLSIGFAPKDVVNAPLKEKKNIEYAILLGRGEPLGKSAFLSRAAQRK